MPTNCTVEHLRTLGGSVRHAAIKPESVTLLALEVNLFRR